MPPHQGQANPSSFVSKPAPTPHSVTDWPPNPTIGMPQPQVLPPGAAEFHQGPPGAAELHQEPPGTVEFHQGPPGVVEFHQGPPGAVEFQARPPGTGRFQKVSPSTPVTTTMHQRYPSTGVTYNLETGQPMAQYMAPSNCSEWQQVPAHSGTTFTQPTTYYDPSTGDQGYFDPQAPLWALVVDLTSPSLAILSPAV